MSTPRCPTCERDLSPSHDENPAHPFCSPRCKLIDLGNWLDGAYRIPGAPTWLEDDDADDGGQLS